jgi:hypothetical protein
MHEAITVMGRAIRDSVLDNGDWVRAYRTARMRVKGSNLFQMQFRDVATSTSRLRQRLNFQTKNLDFQFGS